MDELEDVVLHHTLAQVFGLKVAEPGRATWRVAMWSASSTGNHLGPSMPARNIATAMRWVRTNTPNSARSVRRRFRESAAPTSACKTERETPVSWGSVLRLWRGSNDARSGRAALASALRTESRGVGSVRHLVALASACSTQRRTSPNRESERLVVKGLKREERAASSSGLSGH